MHYTGMAAMRCAAMEHYNLWIVALSILAAVGFSWAALWIAFALGEGEQRGAGMLRVAGGCIMGLGIASMHYIAMSAATFSKSDMAVSMAGTVKVSVLGESGIVTTTIFILLAALGTAALDKRRFLDLRDAHSKLEDIQQALLEGQQKLQEANTMLSELSTKDGLTGLSNRRHFDAMLDKEWRRAHRNLKPLSVLMIDVDCFKALNDTYGHQRGDDCLRQIARVLQDPPHRGYDVVARFGGEEFVVLLPETEVDAAVQIAQSLRQAIRGLEMENEGGLADGVVTVSVGVASRIPQLPEDAESIIADADLALYAAKRCGKDRVEVALALVRA
jgi:diguanylate cyclase (GGDEF)-like protein